jgi:phenylalanyl-tRNA synthetase beta chain
MRSSLVGSLVQVLRHNLSRKSTRVRVFELGRVFSRDTSAVDAALTVAGVSQPMRVAGLACGAAEDLQWGRKERAVDFFDLKGDIEALLAPREARFVADTHPAMHPGRCARIELDGRPVGYVGELHPRWRLAYELPHAPVLFEMELQAALELAVPVFEPVPRQQAVLRDVALVLQDTVTHDALTATLGADPAGLIRSVHLFDIYKPAANAAGWQPGEHSLAVRLELRDEAAPLTDERIAAAVQAAVARTTQVHGARLRA